MNSLDLILVGIILLFSIWGFLRGAVMMVGGLVVAVLAGLFAGQLTELIANLITEKTGMGVNWLHNVLFWISLGALLVAGNIALKFVNILTSVPIVGGLKHIGGMLLGFLQGLLIAGFVAVMISNYPIWEEATQLSQDSVLVKVAVYASSLVIAIWPKDLREVAKVLRS